MTPASQHLHKPDAEVILYVLLSPELMRVRKEVWRIEDATASAWLEGDWAAQEECAREALAPVEALVDAGTVLRERLKELVGQTQRAPATARAPRPAVDSSTDARSKQAPTPAASRVQGADEETRS